MRLAFIAENHRYGTFDYWYEWAKACEQEGLYDITLSVSMPDTPQTWEDFECYRRTAMRFWDELSRGYKHMEHFDAYPPHLQEKIEEVLNHCLIELKSAGINTEQNLWAKIISAESGIASVHRQKQRREEKSSRYGEQITNRFIPGRSE